VKGIVFLVGKEQWFSVPCMPSKIPDSTFV